MLVLEGQCAGVLVILHAMSQVILYVFIVPLS